VFLIWHSDEFSKLSLEKIGFVIHENRIDPSGINQAITVKWNPAL